MDKKPDSEYATTGFGLACWWDVRLTSASWTGQQFKASDKGLSPVQTRPRPLPPPGGGIRISKGKCSVVFLGLFVRKGEKEGKSTCYWSGVHSGASALLLAVVFISVQPIRSNQHGASARTFCNK